MALFEQLSRSRLVGFNPGSEAEPPEGSIQQSVDHQDQAGDVTELAAAVEQDAGPSVLTKLQKWANYEAMGRPVAPTLFIPMKTPMSQEILDNWSLAEAPKHALTVPLLLECQAAAGRDVGLIIDLANHDCLYSDDMPDSLEYEHVQLVAKVLPSREAINEVERIAKSFWSEHPDKYIAIHCAYGFNRTGFVVCSYLCQACGLTVDQALESFAASRPPGVKHEKFIRELFVRYADRTPSPAATPEGTSALGVSPTALGCALLDGLAAEAQLLQQNGEAATVAETDVSCTRGEVLAVTPASSAACASAEQQERQQQHLQQQQHPRHQPREEEEDHHFEDAADMVRRGSQQRRTLSSKSSVSEGLPGGASPGTRESRPGSRSSSRPPSGNGGSFAEHAGGREAEDEEDVSVATALGVGFEASRKLLQRKSSRGGGLAHALASSPGHAAGGLVAGSAESSFANGSSTFSGGPACTSSASDFSAAAVHLEGSNSMRRATSLGLAKALCEDFLQHNGTPSAAGPFASSIACESIACEDGQEAALGSSPSHSGSDRVGQSYSAEQTMSPQQGDRREQQQTLVSGSDAFSTPGCSCFADAIAADAANGPSSSSSGCTSAPAAGSPTKATRSGSPSRRGGIPLPPARSATPSQPPAGMHCQQHFQQHLQQHPPDTPVTPASSTATPTACHGTQQRHGSFPRSVSVDSDNPSLGFGARDALHHLRAGAAGPATSLRGPQALADLFREDSRAELATLDVEEHLQAVAQAASAGMDSPAASLRLPSVMEVPAVEAGDGQLTDSGSGAGSGGSQPSTLHLGHPAQGCATTVVQAPVAATRSTAAVRQRRAVKAGTGQNSAVEQGGNCLIM